MKRFAINVKTGFKRDKKVTDGKVSTVEKSDRVQTVCLIVNDMKLGFNGVK